MYVCDNINTLNTLLYLMFFAFLSPQPTAKELEELKQTRVLRQKEQKSKYTQIRMEQASALLRDMMSDKPELPPPAAPATVSRTTSTHHYVPGLSSGRDQHSERRMQEASELLREMLHDKPQFPEDEPQTRRSPRKSAKSPGAKKSAGQGKRPHSGQVPPSPHRAASVSPRRRPPVTSARSGGGGTSRHGGTYPLNPPSTYAERLAFCARNNPDRAKMLKPFTPDSLTKIYGTCPQTGRPSNTVNVSGRRSARCIIIGYQIDRLQYPGPVEVGRVLWQCT